MAIWYGATKTILTKLGEFRTATEIFSTEVDPNLTPEDVIPTTWLKKVQSTRATVKAASCTAFTIKGIFRLSVKYGGHATSAVFDAAPKLDTETIPGAAFFHGKISRIEPKTRQSKLKSDHALPLTRALKTKTPYIWLMVPRYMTRNCPTRIHQRAKWQKRRFSREVKPFL